MKANTSRRQFLISAAAGAAALAASSVRGRDSDSAPRRPNILFLFADQHQADCLGLLGHHVVLKEIE